MKKFLAVFLGSEAAFKKWQALDADTKSKREKAGMEGWMNWSKEHANSIVQMGSPVGSTKQINASGISDIKNFIGGYTIVQAESHDAAAKLFLNHPHFMMMPGESIELMECLAIPGM